VYEIGVDPIGIHLPEYIEVPNEKLEFTFQSKVEGDDVLSFISIINMESTGEKSSRFMATMRTTVTFTKSNSVSVTQSQEHPTCRLSLLKLSTTSQTLFILY